MGKLSEALISQLQGGGYVDPIAVRNLNRMDNYARALKYGTIQRPGGYSPDGGMLGLPDKIQQMNDIVMGLSGGINFSHKMNQVANSTKSIGKKLRDRYYLELLDAVEGKDVSRIKMTQERARVAKELLKQKAVEPDFDWGKTTQMNFAEEFARQALQSGEKVRFKIPDGPRGSLYVRVGDRGTIRFSDHSPPPGGVGGYSERLGRRHGPATKSVHPGGETLQDALDWLSGR